MLHIILSIIGVGVANADMTDYVRYNTGWDLNVHTNLQDVEAFSNCTLYPPEMATVLVNCDEDMNCTMISRIPGTKQVPATNKTCTSYKTLGQLKNNNQVFLHKTRCNENLNGTIVTSMNNKTYKMCEHVGDAYFLHLEAKWGGVWTWKQCTEMCDVDPNCAACQTDGASCTTFTTFTDHVNGLSAWFKLDEIVDM